MGTWEELDEAILLDRAAAAAAEPGSDLRVQYLCELWNRLLQRYEHTNAQPDLDEAIVVGRQVVADTAQDDAYRVARLVRVAIMLRARFEDGGALADFDEAVDTMRLATRAVAPDDPDFVMYAMALGLDLFTRVERSGSIEDLDEAVGLIRRAVDATPIDHPDRASHLSMLGHALAIRFQRLGSREDLAEAIRIDRAAAEAAGRGRLFRALRSSVLRRMLRAGSGGDNVGSLTREHANRAAFLSTVLEMRHAETGDAADAEQAVALSRQAAQAASGDDVDQAAYLANYRDVLLTRAQRSGAAGDFDDAVRAARRALDTAPADDPAATADHLAGLALTLEMRTLRSGGVKDLDEAIRVGRRAVDGTPPGHPDLPRRLTVLANALRLRYHRTGVVADLDEAIAVGRRTVDATAADHGDRPAVLTHVAIVLRTRFQRFGAADDLTEALGIGRAAVAVVPPGHIARIGLLALLGSLLRARFERFGEAGDLDEAVALARQAVEAAPPDHPDRAALLSLLATALQTRFGRLDTPEDVNEAIRVGLQAVDATPRSHPDRAGRLSSAGLALLARFRATGAAEDLDEAIRAGRRAVRATPADHLDRAVHLFNLALELGVRFQHRGGRRDEKKAMELWTHVVGMRFAPPTVRVQAARAAAALGGRSDPRSCAAVLEIAVGLLPELAGRQLERGDQEFALGGLSGLASDCAAFALEDDRFLVPERAVRALRLLEAGRAVLLSQALDARSDLKELRGADPHLARRYTELCDLLDEPPPEVPGDPAYSLRIDRRVAAKEFEAVLARIRDLPGFATFARLPDIRELVAHAANGPVVTFNVSGYRSDALLLTRSGVTAVALPRLRYSDLIEQIEKFHNALVTFRGREASEVDTANTIEGAALRDADPAVRPDRAQDPLREVLAWLWDAAVEPVLEALGVHGPPDEGAPWPRVWWATGGLLGLLPIHAAGHHAPGPPGRSVIDRVVSSYTPTIRALHHARQNAAAVRAGVDAALDGSARPGPVSSLIVAMPTTPGSAVAGPLPFAAIEAALLAARLPDPVLLLEPGSVPDSVANLDGRPPETPTRDAVLEHLRTCAIAHFACHGTAELADASRSRLLLHDAPLTVADMATVRLEHAELAYLSACRTAFHGAPLLDESVHLASAFQLAGFPHVIAALWEIADPLAPTIADAFYARLSSASIASASALDTGRAAEALHHTLRDLRDQYPDRPSLWGAYIHAGA